MSLWPEQPGARATPAEVDACLRQPQWTPVGSTALCARYSKTIGDPGEVGLEVPQRAAAPDYASAMIAPREAQSWTLPHTRDFRVLTNVEGPASEVEEAGEL